VWGTFLKVIDKDFCQSQGDIMLFKHDEKFGYMLEQPLYLVLPNAESGSQ